MKYFKPSEFKCDGVECFDKMQPELLTRLDALREEVGVPLKINSSWRSPEKNAAEGGAKDSAHLYGYAVDISCTSSSMRYYILKAAIKVGFTRIGIGKTFIHVDCDQAKPQQVAWMY